MEEGITKEIGEVHYNVDKAIENLAEANIPKGNSHQQFAISSSNKLADMLSDILNGMQMEMSGSGMGKPKPGKGQGSGMQLPDIIKKQGELNEQIKEGIEKGGKNPGENSDAMSEELYEIYKQQEQLKGMLNDFLGDSPENSEKAVDAIKKMEELEKELLEKGFTKNVVKKILQLNYELLKLQKATLQQGEDNVRKSETSKVIFEKKNLEAIELKNRYFNYNEILNRQSLPLRTIYKKKVQEYFKNDQQ